MGPKRTVAEWSARLDRKDAELTLAEFQALEAWHACENTTFSNELLKHMQIDLEQLNGRLDRLELFLARNTDYPTSQTQMPDLAALRASGIEE